MIEFKGVSKVYDNGVRALNKVSLKNRRRGVCGNHRPFGCWKVHITSTYK